MLAPSTTRATDTFCEEFRKVSSKTFTGLRETTHYQNYLEYTNDYSDPVAGFTNFSNITDVPKDLSSNFKTHSGLPTISRRIPEKPGQEYIN